MMAGASQRSVSRRGGALSDAQFHRARFSMQAVINAACELRGAEESPRALSRVSRVKGLKREVGRKERASKRKAEAGDAGRLRALAEDNVSEEAEGDIFHTVLAGLEGHGTVPLVAGYALQSLSRRLGLRPDEVKGLSMDMVCSRRFEMRRSRRTALEGFLRCLVEEEDRGGKTGRSAEYVKARGALRHRKFECCPVFALALLFWLEYEHPDAPFLLCTFLVDAWREQPLFRGTGGRGRRREMSRAATAP